MTKSRSCIFVTSKLQSTIQLVYILSNERNKPLSIMKIIHEWTIRNFGFFYIENPKYTPLSFLQSDIFSAKNGRQFFLRLYPKELDRKFEKNLSISLHLHESESLKVSCKLMIIGYEESGYNIQENSADLTIENEIQFQKFISVDEVCNLKRGHLLDGKLTIRCEMTVLGNFKIKPEVEEETKSESNAHVIVTRLQHNWNINGFLHYAEQNDICLSSKDFCHSDQGDNKFFLRLWPKGRDEHSEAHVSLYLYLLTRQREEQGKMTLQYKISLVDSEEKEEHTKLNRHQIFGGCEIGCSKFILLDRLLHKVKNCELLQENLKINCLVEIIGERRNKSNKRLKTEDQSSSSTSSLGSNNSIINSVINIGRATTTTLGDIKNEHILS